MRYTGSKAVKTLIFDLGNVIVDLNEERVLNSFALYTSRGKDEIKQLIIGNRDLFNYEVGNISTSEFILSIKKDLNMDISDNQFEEIWNSMLKDIPSGKLELLKKCSINYQTMIMSNTNDMHERAFDRMVAERSQGNIMLDFVDTAYYSHKMRLRKPDFTIFKSIVETHSLAPSEIAFFDDKIENIEAAKQIGIEAVLIESPSDLYNHFI